MERYIETEKGIIDLLKRHETVGTNLWKAIDNINAVIYTLGEVLPELGYAEHIHKLEIQKKELKKILDTDFDSLAIIKKFE